MLVLLMQTIHRSCKLKTVYRVYADDEEISKHDTYDEALQAAKDGIDCGMTDLYVVECGPVTRVRRGKMVVTALV